jgi:predicted  nucleic acid-binding Zn-ribbon protein
VSAHFGSKRLTCGTTARFLRAGSRSFIISRIGEFEKIEEIQHTDEERASERFLDAKIQNATDQLRLLESQEQRLNSELSTLSQKSNALSATLSDAADSGGLSPAPAQRTGTFFQQLRHLEAQVETRENEKSGLRAVIHSLQADVIQNEILVLL